MLGGSALALTAAIGVVRFPDTLSRMHAATKPQVLGLLLVLVGAAIRLRGNVDVGMLILTGVVHRDHRAGRGEPGRASWPIANRIFTTRSPPTNCTSTPKAEPMARTDDDTWDITESVGATALGVAWARSQEATAECPLFTDPYAEVFVDEATRARLAAAAADT